MSPNIKLMGLVTVFGIMVTAFFILVVAPPDNSSGDVYTSNLSADRAPVKIELVEGSSVALVESFSDQNKTDVFLKNPLTQEEILFTTVPFVAASASQSGLVANGHVYLILVSGETGAKDEVWKYNSDRQGQKIFVGDDLYFPEKSTASAVTIMSGSQEYYLK